MSMYINSNCVLLPFLQLYTVDFPGGTKDKVMVQMPVNKWCLDHKELHAQWDAIKTFAVNELTLTVLISPALNMIIFWKVQCVLVT